jgi:hypothetical protein
MYCKCSIKIPELRYQMGYRTCINCSSEARWSGVPVINHKTGNEIQIIKDPEVAAEFLAKSARVGFGTSKGMTTGYKRPQRIETKIKEIPPKPVPDQVISKITLPNEYEKVGSEVMQILESDGFENAYNYIQAALQNRRIFRNHANTLHSIIHEKYRYLGSVPWNDEGDISKAMLPLVLLMDHKAKPSWCPRWFLRLLHKIGNHNSSVRVYNRTLSDLLRHLTKGYHIWDYKTKWQSYDLRISISGDEDCWFLAHSIESSFYRRGLNEDLLDQLKDLNPEGNYKGLPNDLLKVKLQELENQSFEEETEI